MGKTRIQLCPEVFTVCNLGSHEMVEIDEDRNLYGFQTEVRVRLNETDAVGIVFFGNYAAYFDVGRMDYLGHLELNQYGGAVRDLIPGAVVDHRVSFMHPAQYNDTLLIHVRIAHLGRTSYTFHFLITDKKTRRLNAKGHLTLVWLDERFKPVVLPKSFRDAVEAFESNSLAGLPRG